MVTFLFFFFFFQAEDGIRDLYVTGVHVCSSDLPRRAPRTPCPCVSHRCTAAPAHRRTSAPVPSRAGPRSEEHTSELQSRRDLVCRLLLEKKKKTTTSCSARPGLRSTRARA